MAKVPYLIVGEELKQIVKEYVKDGMNINRIAKKHYVHHGTIKRSLIREGVKFRQRNICMMMNDWNADIDPYAIMKTYRFNSLNSMWIAIRSYRRKGYRFKIRKTNKGGRVRR